MFDGDIVASIPAASMRKKWRNAPMRAGHALCTKVNQVCVSTQTAQGTNQPPAHALTVFKREAQPCD
jgi:hypothetical protein